MTIAAARSRGERRRSIFHKIEERSRTFCLSSSPFLPRPHAGRQRRSCGDRYCRFFVHGEWLSLAPMVSLTPARHSGAPNASGCAVNLPAGLGDLLLGETTGREQSSGRRQDLFYRRAAIFRVQEIDLVFAGFDLFAKLVAIALSSRFPSA